MNKFYSKILISFCFSLGLFFQANSQVSFTSETLSFLDNSSGMESCIVDMNNDQLDDIVRLSNSQVRIHFQTQTGFSENTITPSPSIQNNGSASWSIAAGDIDEDGYTDLFLGGGQRGTFLFNNNATSFTTDNQSVFIFCQRSTFADIDNDGDLDAFVCHDVDESHPYRNDGSRTMVLDQTLVTTADRPGNYSAIWVDYDNDRDIDLYITKCKGGAAPGDIDRTNLFYRNNGDGTFTEIAESIGLADNAQSWTTVFDDLDNDGDLDAFVVNHDFSNRYYRNNLVETGTADFTDIIGSTGISANDLGAWEAVAADFDNDGDLDILSELNNELYVNNGNNTYTGQSLSFDEGAIGDIDNDGDLDVVNGNQLYRNNGNTNDYIKVNLKGIISNSNGIGARIEANGSFGKQLREVRSGQGFSHMSSLTTHFGFEVTTTRATVDNITVYWPSGTVDIMQNPTLNTTIEIEEGETLSLQDTMTDQLLIYPNPVKTTLKISSSFNDPDMIYSVFSITGKRVLNAKLNSNTIDVSQLSSGNYILRLMSEGRIQTQKFIKQ